MRINHYKNKGGGRPWHDLPLTVLKPSGQFWKPRMGKTINYPRNLLPKDAKEGDVFDLNINMNQEATEERKTNIKGIVDDLKKKDKGGDIQL
jgi:hypothetical protein